MILSGSAGFQNSAYTSPDMATPVGLTRSSHSVHPNRARNSPVCLSSARASRRNCSFNSSPVRLYPLMDWSPRQYDPSSASELSLVIFHLRLLVKKFPLYKKGGKGKFLDARHPGSIRLWSGLNGSSFLDYLAV